MDWKQGDPLARCTGETRKSNIALHDYALMGPGRSLGKLASKYQSGLETLPPTRYHSRLRLWSSRYHWQDRVSAWEATKAAEDEILWDERRRQIRQGEWEQAQKLITRAERMLKFPLEQVEKVEEVYKDGRAKEVVIVKPVRWSQRDVAQFMKVASELGRLAAEMEQRRQAIDVTSGGEPLRVVYIDDWRDSWRNDQAPQAASGPADSDARSGQVQVVGGGAAVAQDDDGDEHSD